jgi:hypothetical protein
MGSYNNRVLNSSVLSELNGYLVKLSDRNMVKFYLEELHDISLNGNIKSYSKDRYFPDTINKLFHKLGVLKTVTKNQRVPVDWDRVWDILG